MGCLALLPLEAYGTLTVTDRGTGTSGSSEASTVMSPTSTIAAGSTGVLCIAADNANGASVNFPVDITDSVGNTWHRINDTTSGGSNAAVEIAIYNSPKLATQLTSGGNVTVTYTAANVTAKAWTFSEIAPSAGNIAIFTGNSGKSTSGTGVTTLSLSTSTQQVSIGNVTIACAGIEGADSFTGDSDTTNGTWSTQQHTGVGTGATGMSIASQSKVQTTALGFQVYDPTFTTADARAGIVVFKEIGDAGRGVQSTPNSSATTFVIETTKPLAVGSMGVLCIAVANYGSGGSVPAAPTGSGSGSIVDAAGNTWTSRQSGIYDPAGASAGSEMAIYTAPITNAMSMSNTITVTWDGAVSATVKCAVLYEFVPDSGKSFAFVTSGTGTAAASTAPTVTTASANSGDIVIGLASAEDPETFTADSDTSNGSWSQMVTGSTGATVDGSNQSIASQYKITTGAGTQTYNLTMTSADVVIGYATIRQSSAASATNGFFQY